MRFMSLVRRWLVSPAPTPAAPDARATSSTRARLMCDRGSVPVEYIAVFAFVSIGIALSFVKLGPTLLQAWGTSEHVLLANKP
jgi:hypothetical protein